MANVIYIEQHLEGGGTVMGLARDEVIVGGLTFGVFFFFIALWAIFVSVGAIAAYRFIKGDQGLRGMAARVYRFTPALISPFRGFLPATLKVLVS